MLFCSFIYIWGKLGSERGSALPKVTQQAGGHPSHRQLPVGSEVGESAWHKFQGPKPETVQSPPPAWAVFLCEGHGGIPLPQPTARPGGPASQGQQLCLLRNQMAPADGLSMLLEPAPLSSFILDRTQDGTAQESAAGPRKQRGGQDSSRGLQEPSKHPVRIGIWLPISIALR